MFRTLAEIRKINMQSELALKAQYLVRHRKTYRLTIARIAEETGLSRDWLIDFTYDRFNIHNAAVSKIEAIVNFFEKQSVDHV